MRQLVLTAISFVALAACSGAGEAVEPGNGATAPSSEPSGGRLFSVQPVGEFKQPWAMAFLPGSNRALITEKGGTLQLVSVDNGAAVQVAGVPSVDAGGQGGLGDVALHPDFANNGFVYLSWVEAGQGDTRGAVVGRARLVTEGAPRLEGMQIIWRQAPKVSGRGHYGHRLLFSPDGYLFITNGDRQKFEPAQDDNQTLGKIVRLTDAGGIPNSNPFYNQGSAVRGQIWTKGHRNPLAIAFDGQGRLWEHEMGPKGGDEFNLIEKGKNYGYPIVSNGEHYDDKPIPDHNTRPEFAAPQITWTPVISPSSMIFYSGSVFPAWKGSFLIGALSGKALVRVGIDGNTAREIERFDMGERIREVEQAPDGSIYVLEDQTNGSGGRLLRLTAAR